MEQLFTENFSLIVAHTFKNKAKPAVLEQAPRCNLAPFGVYGVMNSQNLLAFLLALLSVPVLRAEPIAVRNVEGSLQGFLVLRTTDGKTIASGNLTQTIQGNRVAMHLVFRFRDGSLQDETATFTQEGSFRLINDHLIQKGAKFPKPLDLQIDAASGNVIVRYQEKGQDKVESEHMDLPDDLANGVIFDELKNIAPDAKDVKVSWLAATPKPRIVKLSITSVGGETFSVAGRPNKSTKFNIKVEIGGVAGVVAPWLGKQPSDMRFWIANGPVPALVKLEGALYFGGPIWRIEMASPVWSRTSR